MRDIFPFYTIGHFINQPLNPTGFEIVRFETMAEPEIEDPHKHTFYEITWIDRGSGTQVIDYREYPNADGSLFFVSPGQVHHFEDWQPLTGGSVFFTGQFFSFNQQGQTQLFEATFLDNFYANPFLKPKPEAYAEIRQTIDLLYIEKQRADYSEPIARAYLHILLAQIQRCVNETVRQPLPRNYVLIYKKLKKLIDENYATQHTASDYACHLNISRHHLNLITKTVTGKTISALIRERSLLEAKRMLTFTDRTVSEIAAALRFYDLAYFGKIFRADTGVAPLAFRQMMSEKYRNLQSGS